MIKLFVDSIGKKCVVNGKLFVRDVLDIELSGVDIAAVNDLWMGVTHKNQLVAVCTVFSVDGAVLKGSLDLNKSELVALLEECESFSKRSFGLTIYNIDEKKTNAVGEITIYHQPFSEAMEAPTALVPLGYTQAQWESIKTAMENAVTNFDEKVANFDSELQNRINANPDLYRGKTGTPGAVSQEFIDLAQEVQENTEKAEKWANAGEDVVVEDGKFSASHYAKKAAAVKQSVDEKAGEIDTQVNEKKSEIDGHTSTKKGELDSHTADKKNELNSHTATKEGEITNHTNTKKGELDSHTSDKKGELNSHTDTKKAEIRAINAHPPIQQSGNWWVWNENLVPPAYEDSGIKAKGEKGDPGNPGSDGENGKSSYQLWVEDGNVGTEQDFLHSLIGAQGEQGLQGPAGQDSEYLFHPVGIENLYATAKANPSWVLFFVTGHPDWPNGVQVIKGAGDKFFIRKNDEADLLHPLTEVFLDFKNGYSINLNNNEDYGFDNSKTSPTWLFSVDIDGDVILVDKSERLAEVQVTHPQAVHGGVQKVVQGVTALLGSVCVFDGNGDVVDFMKGGMLSDGSPIPDCLPRGIKPLPHGTDYGACHDYKYSLFPDGGLYYGCRFSDFSENMQIMKKEHNGALYFYHRYSPDGNNYVARRSLLVQRGVQTTATEQEFKIDFMQNLPTATRMVVKVDGVAIYDQTRTGPVYNVVVPNTILNDLKVHYIEVERHYMSNTGTNLADIYIYPFRNSAAVGTTIRVGSWQSRINSEFDAPIPTNGSPVTRYADIPQLPAEVETADITTAVLNVDVTEIVTRESGIIKHYVDGVLQVGSTPDPMSIINRVDGQVISQQVVEQRTMTDAEVLELHNFLMGELI